MKTISTKELNERLEAGPLALFDVRGDVEYDQAHIPDAKSAPLGSLVFRVADVMNPNSEVVVYSNSQDCTLATQAAERLENLRLTNVSVYSDGLAGWKEAGHKAVTSAQVREHTWGEVKEVRPLLVDRENSYGGAFKGKPSNVEGAGG